MQEDIENRTVTLMVNSSKFTGRTLLRAVQKFLAHMKQKSQQKAARTPMPCKDVTPRGKQTVRQLIAKDQGVNSVELTDPHIRSFDRIARKYGVDYAVKKVKGDPPKFMIFFKGRDEDAITSAMMEYAAKQIRREERPSVLKLLTKVKTMIASREPIRNKEKERSR